MAREINGTTVILSDGTGAIVGQMEMTLTINGTPIDISNKTALDNIALIDGTIVGKQMQIAGTIVYNDNARYRNMRADSLSGTQDTYTMTYTGAATTQETLSASMVPTGLSDSIPHGDKVSSSITFLSSGVITHVAAV